VQGGVEGEEEADSTLRSQDAEVMN